MIYLKLFLSFLEIGTVSFGGGYGMISLVREKVVSNGWLTDSELLNIVAVAESTPGPIAVNMATFVGAEQGGILGSLCATLGVVLPSFIIILIIAALIKNLLKYEGVSAFLSGVRPCVVGMIVATAVTMLLTKIFSVSDIHNTVDFDFTAAIIFLFVALFAFIYKKLKNNKPSPIFMIVFSAVLGVVFYSL